MNRRQMLSVAASVVVSQTFRGRRVGRAGGASCVLAAPLTEGPFFVDEKLARSDLRSDPATGVVSAGAPLRLRFLVSRVDRQSCGPLTGAYVDVWHCNADGAYSDISAMHGPPPGGPPPGMTQATRYEFTSQLFFDDGLTDDVHSRPPYSGRSSRDMRNADDDIFASLSPAERDALTLRPARSSAGIYSAVVNLGVNPSAAG
jgi:hypothetical protein